MALLYLGRQPTYCVSALISTFEADDHFRTYLGEMNPSISANINVLSCLLLLDEPIPYIPQIIKASSFVYAQVLADQVKEKWVSSAVAFEYVHMALELTIWTAYARVLLDDASVKGYGASEPAHGEGLRVFRATPELGPAFEGTNTPGFT